MKVNIHKIRETIDEAHPVKMVATKAEPVKKKIGRGRRKITKKFHRWMMSSTDRMFSAELTGRRANVTQMQFTVFAEGEPFQQGLDTVATAVRSVYPDWGDESWLRETAVSMKPIPEGKEAKAESNGKVGLMKLELRGVPVLFVKVA